MLLIDPQAVQVILQSMKDQDIFICLEMTTGAYASHMDNSKFTASTFIHNGIIRFSQGSIAGDGPYRIGLKTQNGWVYSQGLTHWDDSESDRLILAGHDSEGKLVVGLQLGRSPF
ncbi:YojF family protein [Marinicrinis lubricantis]|uniref:YojF family protein n=1 Tax=Marinicrinis lubricantis TaxID=2086470 RepID=A0ABW1IQ02_9BACL